MPVEDFWNNLQRIGGEGRFDVAPKLPAPKPRPTYTNQMSAPSMGGGSALEKLMAAIKKQESGGNYSATNPSSASGAYQILRSNFEGAGGWDREALGRDVSYNDFMGSSQLQDAIARYKLGQYLKKYGAAGAAVSWYGGEGAVSHMYDRKPQNGYPSLYDYWNSVLSKM